MDHGEFEMGGGVVDGDAGVFGKRDDHEGGALAYAIGLATYAGKLAVGGFLLAVFETSIAKMRVFRVPDFLGIALMLGFLGVLLRFLSRSF